MPSMRFLHLICYQIYWYKTFVMFLHYPFNIFGIYNDNIAFFPGIGNWHLSSFIL